MFGLHRVSTWRVIALIFGLLPGLVSPLIEEEKKATFLTANVGESVVFNCPLDFPHDVAIPYILYWNKDSKSMMSWHDGVMETWEQGGYKHRIGFLAPDSAYGKGSINLTSIRESDAGWYECKVFFPNRTPSTRLNGTWFHLTVNGGDLLGIPPINQTVMEGDSAEFACVTKDSAESVVWHKDGVPLSELAELNQRALVTPGGSLTIRTHMDDVGRYTCHVSSAAGDTQEASAYLNVQYKAKIVYSPPEKFFPYGRPAILDCHFRANPPLTKLRWEKDGFLFDPFNVQGVFFRKNGSLYFSKVDESHGGDYVCTPFNDLGTDGPSPPIHVMVQRPPVFTLQPQNLYLRKIGDSLEMPCDALDGDGSHRPSIYWFKKDGSPLPPNRSYLTGGNLTIASIEESDRGLYQCVASNEAATITADVEVLIENSPARAPYNLSATSAMTSISLRWIPGHSKPQQEYSVWYRRLDAPEWKTLKIARGASQVTVDNLTPGVEYELMVLSQDQRGDGMFSKIIRYRTKQPESGIEGTSKGMNQPLESFQQISSPRNLRVHLDVEGYLVSWEPPELGAKSLRVYTVSWYEDGRKSEVIKADTTENSFIVKDLKEERTYHFRVTALSDNEYEATSEEYTIHIPDYHRARVINIGVVVGLLVMFATAAAIWYVRNVYRRTNHKQAHFDDS